MLLWVRALKPAGFCKCLTQRYVSEASQARFYKMPDLQSMHRLGCLFLCCAATGGQCACDVTTITALQCYMASDGWLFYSAGENGGVRRVLYVSAGKWRAEEWVPKVVKKSGAGCVKVEEEIGKQLIVIRRRTCSV